MVANQGPSSSRSRLRKRSVSAQSVARPPDGCHCSHSPRSLSKALGAFLQSPSFLYPMAFPFLYSWWHSSDKQASFVPQKDMSCEEVEEEDDEMCWFLGEMLLFYILAVAIFKLCYLGVNQFFRKKPCGGLTCNWKAHSTGSQRCSCQFRCKLTLCSLLKKLLGWKEEEGAGAPPPPPSSSSPTKKQLKDSLSLLSQQTFCDSQSSGSANLGSQGSSWKCSQTGDAVSVGSRKKPGLAYPKDPEPSWARRMPCVRCKAKRTQEWLAQHFSGKDAPDAQSKKN